MAEPRDTEKKDAAKKDAAKPAMPEADLSGLDTEPHSVRIDEAGMADLDLYVAAA